MPKCLFCVLILATLTRIDHSDLLTWRHPNSPRISRHHVKIARPDHRLHSTVPAVTIKPVLRPLPLIVSRKLRSPSVPSSHPTTLLRRMLYGPEFRAFAAVSRNSSGAVEYRTQARSPPVAWVGGTLGPTGPDWLRDHAIVASPAAGHRVRYHHQAAPPHHTAP